MSDVERGFSLLARDGGRRGRNDEPASEGRKEGRKEGRQESGRDETPGGKEEEEESR